jgi:ABC-2 type transport system ATP-binding protein
MIEVKDLTKYYNKFLALDKVNFSVSKGEILGLLGPNGAGKTTTLRLLTGYLEPSMGEIKVGKYRLPRDHIQVKSIMGYLPESVPIYKNMMVYEYLFYVGEVRGIERDKLISRIKNVAKKCQIKDIMDKDIHELSKGLLQRVGIASVLLHDPEILILDEPTTGLDPNQILEIRDLIKETGKYKTIILSSHILSEVEATCDRVIIINKGKIVADGSPSYLKDMYMGKTIINICLKNASIKEVQQQFNNIQEIEQIKFIEEEDAKIKLELTLKLDIRDKVYNIIKNTSWILLEFYKKKTSLENIFKEITTEN